MSYARDVITLRYGKVNDGTMRFSRRSPAVPQLTSSSVLAADATARSD
jgi:hypothetical protein